MVISPICFSGRSVRFLMCRLFDDESVKISFIDTNPTGKTFACSLLGRYSIC